MPLSINSSTGRIDTSASTVGTYTVTYTTSEGSATTQVTIQDCFTNTKSLSFDGVDDRLQIADSNTFSFGNGTSDSPFSVSAWIKTETNGKGIISKWGGNPSGYEWIIFIVNNVVRVALYDAHPSHNQRREGNTTVTTGEWINVIVTYDGRGGSNANQGIKIYINGEEESSYTDSGAGTYVAMHNTTRPVQIGAYNTAANFNGNIDEVGVYNAQLNQNGVNAVYNNGSPTDLSAITTSLVAWYRMGDDDTFPTITDNKGSNDATMTNMASNDIVNDTP